MTCLELGLLVEGDVGHLLAGVEQEYLALLEKMFCAAPTSTAANRGVSAILARMGSTTPPKRMRPKKATPVMRSTVGVMSAATPQPNLRKMTRDSSIMTKVTAPARPALHMLATIRGFDDDAGL